MTCQLQNAKSNVPKFCKVYARQNQKTNLIYLYLVKTFPLIFHIKIVFRKLFWLKLSILKNTLNALNTLLRGAKKRSDILKQAYSF